MNTALNISSGPHIRDGWTTRSVMLTVAASLLPTAVLGVVFHGLNALWVILLAVASAVASEWVFDKICHKPDTWKDGSAVVTGLLLALNLSTNVPLWQCALGSIFAIVLVKCAFGGMGHNFANPAIVGRIGLLLSFTTQMTTWPLTRLSRTADVVTGPTPLGLLADGALSEAPSLGNMFVGNIGGAMGETCTIAIFIGLAILIWKKIISPIIPVCYIGTVFVFSLIYYAVVGGEYSALHMALFHVLAGGCVFGATFCATDYVTSPIMKHAKIAFGIGCGLVTMIIRLFCAYPEGASFAILFMNVMAPLLDMVAQNRFYGIGAEEKAAKKAAKEAGKEAGK